ncbi:uncharacterized protein BT62DRAFT_1027976 [Guyanagaster necrorhizus]|uniref:F-box domain-containing protein n=1 Tax=Guyanagaster necrorhizus TaxID=856835 RepID=A0A9P7VSH7_9AGAR|nr:uncharacterized protein BT62DRAFT_1027976 [Guyanagaster necrorhizus MCA 3950]KAG7445166.1 hypothetical protein BT62DRAFT_1027976 [Guyanagaster necrorhizus MCA 3950]
MTVESFSGRIPGPVDARSSCWCPAFNPLLRANHAPKAMPFLDLPVDLFLAVFRFLSLDDILRIRRVCRLPSVWHLLLRTQIITQSIPFPSGPPGWLNNLGAGKLEGLVVRAVRSRRNWTSPSPRATRQLEISIGPTRLPAQERRVIALKFLTRGPHSYILSAALSIHARPNPAQLSIECWDINRTPFCIARRQGPWLGGCAFNKDASYPPSVAVKGQDSSLQVFSISTTAHNPSAAFATIARMPGPVHELLAFSGSIVLIRNHNDQLFVCDVRRVGHRMELVRPPLPPPQAAQPTQAEACFETLIFNDFLIILRSRFLAIYSLHLFRQATTSRGVLHPLAHHVWQWSVDSGRLAFHTSYARGPQPISVLIRFASSFPWPTNMLNHFVIYPNPPGSHLLYDFTPIQVQSISAPLRLFALTDMAIGEYNTAVWLDTDTESYFLQASSGQRLAGCILSRVNEGRVTDTNASTVYNMHEGASWTRVSLDERNDKIAIGTLDGRIIILELA